MRSDVTAAPPVPRARAGVDTAAVVSPRTGIIRQLVPFVSELLPRTTVARLAPAARPEVLPGVPKDYGVTGFGIGTSLAEARSAAVGETVERYGSLVGAAHARVEWGTFDEFEGDAVHGESFVLPHPKESSWTAFDEKAPRGWVVGHDLTEDRRVLVPAQLALPSYKSRFEGEELAPWTTNGLAAHTDPSAAVLAGLREIEERDAFTIRHLNRWTPPEIPFAGICDDVDGFVASAPRWHAMTVRAWDLTLDLGQPVVLAGVLTRSDRVPPFCFGAACRGDYPSALRKAVLEAFQISAVMSRRGYPDRAEPGPMEDLAEPEEHIRMSCLPGYRDTLDWLLDDHADWNPPDTSNTSDTSDTSAGCTTLDAAVDAVARRGMRVITVDLTPPDLRGLGWHVCKVLVPGAQPLDFGALQSRTGRRLYDLPVELGYRREPAREDELNPAPHFFA
ncbi:YcaO-like family protein [Streptomyces armeniacus]|nr:YcaO-like family protein [Streptomyces armeniacus]